MSRKTAATRQDLTTPPEKKELERHTRTKRDALRFIGLLPLAAAARAQGGQEYPIRADDGAPVQNFRIPSELDPATLPGIVWKGAKAADVILYEFIDYDCAYCRKAARDIDSICANDPDLRIGIFNNLILSLDSVQAAKAHRRFSG